MVVPYRPISVNFKTETEDVNNQIRALCRAILPGWEDVPDDSIKFSKISGGISNILVKADPSGYNGLSAVAVKVFGDKTELLIDRETEKTILIQLNQHDFGVKVLAFFENGRIEKFMPCKTLTPDEMSDPAVVPFIARRLAAFHALPIDLSKTPAAAAAVAEQGDEKTANEDAVFRMIRGWLRMASELSFPDADKAAAFAKLDLQAMRRDVDELEELSRRLSSPTVFAHCDLLSGNILIVSRSESSAAVTGDAAPAFTSRSASELLAAPADAQDAASYAMQFIDFEYSCFTTRGFDLGNHFNEYAGFDCDYSKYPDAASQYTFLKHYLGTGAGAGTRSGKNEEEEEEEEVEESVLAALSVEANFYALVSHMYWGVWALIQARYSSIDFDYLSYSELRWGEFRRRREEFTAPLRASGGEGKP